MLLALMTSMGILCYDKRVSKSPTYLRPEVLRCIVWLHMWGDIDTSDLVQNQREFIYPGRDSSYITIRVIFGHLDSPRSCTVTAIQNVLRILYWWENQSFVKDKVEDAVLNLKSLCFFLLADKCHLPPPVLLKVLHRWVQGVLNDRSKTSGILDRA